MESKWKIVVIERVRHARRGREEFNFTREDSEKSPHQNISYQTKRK